MFSRALLVLSFISVAFATVYITNPTANTVYQGGQNGTVTWQDDGKPPTLADFGSARLGLYVGNTNQQTNVLNITTLDVSRQSSFTFPIDAKIGPNGKFYFVRFDTVNTTNLSQAFSAVFELANMTGSFSSAIQSEIAGTSTAPFGAVSTAASANPTSLAKSTASTTPTGTSSKTAATAKSTSGAMGIKAGWAGLVFGAVVGVTLF